MALDLSQDPYVPSIGTLPARATAEEALSWVRRQRHRHSDATGFSFAIADVTTNRALGRVGLWVRNLSEGRATIGYESYIEPWNTASVRVAERTGYKYEGLLRSHQEIAGKRVDMSLHAAVREVTQCSYDESVTAL
nr:GNAT family N-acetyltransferase [Arthrobacter sp. Br18]